jgi:hypothetical protein
MTELTYPNFIANQVLTNRQLNDLRDYLDAQTRIGRLRTVGTGILCGLTWHLDEGAGETVLRIERGHGLTSGGYLLSLDPDDGDTGAVEFVGTARYCDPAADPDAEPDDEAACPVPLYPPWVTGVDPPRHIDLMELATREQLTQAPDRFAPLTADDLDGRVVVLYLEAVRQELDSCIVTSCEGMGEDVHFGVRALLAQKDDLDALPGLPGCPEALPPLYLPRFHAFVRETEAGSLPEIRDADEIHRAFVEAVSFGAERLADRLETLFHRYGRRFDLDRTAVRRALSGLARIREAMDDEERRLGPVLYDLLRLLFDAVNAVAQRACAATRSCTEAVGFDRHLLLGSRDQDRGYRHLFRPAPPHQAEGDGDADVAYLFQRLVRVLDGLELEGRGGELEIRLLPSGLPAEPMATRAVPLIVRPDAVRRFWPDDRCCDARPLVHAFLFPDDTHDDLPFSMETVEVDARVPTLYRLEGHLRRDARSVVEQLVALRRSLHVEFTIVVLGFDELEDLAEWIASLSERGVEGVMADVYGDFVRARPGMEPLHGVPPGGTLALVVEDGTIVADFALHCCTALPERVDTSFLSGMVVNDGPLEGVTVTLSPPHASDSTVQTNEDGRFDFGAIPPGTYTVAAGREGFHTQSVTVTLEPGESESVILLLQEADVRVEITGIVYDVAEPENRVGGAEVTVLTAPDAQTTTDDDGRFAFADLPHSATHRLRVVAEGFQSATVPVPFGPDETSRHVEVPLLLDTGSIGGFVVDEATGDPIGGARVQITDDERTTIRTSEEGAWQFTDLGPGTYEIRATAEGYGQETATRQLTPGQQITDVEIALPALTAGVTVLLCGGDHSAVEIRWNGEVVLDATPSPALSARFAPVPGEHEVEVVRGDNVIASATVSLADETGHVVVVTGQLVEGEAVISAIPLGPGQPIRRGVFARFANAYPEDSAATFVVNGSVAAEAVAFGTATGGRRIPAALIDLAGENRAGSRSGRLDLSDQTGRSGTVVLCRETIQYVGDDGRLISATPIPNR